MQIYKDLSEWLTQIEENHADWRHISLLNTKIEPSDFDALGSLLITAAQNQEYGLALTIIERMCGFDFGESGMERFVLRRLAESLKEADAATVCREILALMDEERTKS